jgi:hypothetical protein
MNIEHSFETKDRNLSSHEKKPKLHAGTNDLKDTPPLIRYLSGV